MADENKQDPQEEAKKILAEKEKASGMEYDQKINPEIQTNPETGRQTLGMAEKPQKKEAERQENKRLADELGWHNIPIQDLPSAGLFYVDDVEVAIRAAKVAEIRHFSTIDEEDPFDIDDKLNSVIDKCSKVRLNGSMASWKDLKDEDRFYLIFAIRDLTFKEGENKLHVSMDCEECDQIDKVELKNGLFDYYKIEGRMMKYYSPEEKCFDFTGSKIGNFKLYVPSLGTTSFIKKYIQKKQQNKEKYDETFIRIAPFLFDDWRLLDDATYQKMEYDSYGWDEKKYSVMYKLTEKIRFGVKLNINQACSDCGAEVTAPLSFPDGIKSLFIISDDNVFKLL